MKRKVWRKTVNRRKERIAAINTKPSLRGSVAAARPTANVNASILVGVEETQP
jgi:hypothetical protein